MLDATIQKILALDDLRPSPNVNELFTRLVGQIIDAPSDATFAATTRRRVQDVASRSETEMEIYWAQKIIASSHPQLALAQFPYCDNYAKLVEREVALIESSGCQLDKRSKVLMVGSGPLPMTAFELMRQRQVLVDHVDVSSEAIEICQSVGEKLGISCGHILGDGAKVVLESEYDVVVIAGLAGESVIQKQAIIDNIASNLKTGGRILLRSAKGARALLYPAVKSSDFNGVRLLQEYHPNDDVINSVFIYEKEHA